MCNYALKKLPKKLYLSLGGLSLVHLTIQSDRVSYNVNIRSLRSETGVLQLTTAGVLRPTTVDSMQILMLWPQRKFWTMDVKLLRLNCNGSVVGGTARLLLYRYQIQQICSHLLQREVANSSLQKHNEKIVVVFLQSQP